MGRFSLLMKPLEGQFAGNLYAALLVCLVFIYTYKLYLNHKKFDLYPENPSSLLLHRCQLVILYLEC